MATKFRTVFKLPSGIKINWFPGHMKKGFRDSEQTMKGVDCVIEVVDARAPFSSRNLRLSDLLQNKTYVLVLNKADLMDPTFKQPVLERYRQLGLTNVFYMNCKSQDDGRFLKQSLIPDVIKQVHDKGRLLREEEVAYNFLVIGVPNTGKSSFINLCRQQVLRMAGRPAPVGAIPGLTRAVGNKIKVPLVYIIDTPGILQPNIRDVEAGMRMALCENIKDSIIGREHIVDYLLYWCNKNEDFRYVKHFGLSQPLDSVTEFLYEVGIKNKLSAHSQNYAGATVQTVDLDGAAALVLKSFRSGALGAMMLDKDLLQSSNLTLDPTSFGHGLMSEQQLQSLLKAQRRT